MPSPRLPTILPTPRSYVPAPGRFRLRDGMPIVLDGPGSVDLVSARALQADARARGLGLPIVSHRDASAPGPHLALRSADVGSISPEAYRLEVTPERVVVSATSPAGRRFGIETLRQLVDRRGDIPACTVEDEPALEIRGVLLDVSRGKVPKPETVREIIDLCARLKLNALMLYTEHTFRFQRHPKIGADASPLDAETMRELDAYAADRCVELIPCLQSLGHMSQVLKHPEYAHLDESDAGWTLSPAEPGSYALLEDLYDEYLPNFRSPWFNANCDEPWDLCKGKSKAREEESGPGSVYLEHVRRLRELAARNGKRTMIWGDVVHAYPQRIPEIDRDLVLLDWWYEDRFIDFERVEVFRDNGIDFLVCPGTSTWNCLFPRVAISNRNIALWGEAARRHGAMGMINTDWGDYGHYNLQANSWFGYAMGAQHAWAGACADEHFDRAFSRVVFGDTSGATARLYRSLGEVHDAGFLVINGCALQCLYFDDVEDATFVAAAEPRALARSERALEKVRGRLATAAPKFGGHVVDGELAWRELSYAADASLHAIHKAQAGQEYLAWRREPGLLASAGRRHLSDRLTLLANEQAALGRRFRKLWRTRSFESNLDRNEARLSRSVKSLRRAARALQRNRPTPAPVPRELNPRDVLQAVRDSYESPEREIRYPA